MARFRLIDTILSGSTGWQRGSSTLALPSETTSVGAIIAAGADDLVRNLPPESRSQETAALLRELNGITAPIAIHVTAHSEPEGDLSKDPTPAAPRALAAA